MTDHRPPLIVTATPNVCWLDPAVEFPETAEDMAAEARRCAEAGAAILHMHADDWPPRDPGGAGLVRPDRAVRDVEQDAGASGATCSPRRRT